MHLQVMDAIERWAAIHEAIMVSSRRTRHISDQQRSCGSLGDPPAMYLPVTRRTGPAPVVLDDVRQGAPTMIRVILTSATRMSPDGRTIPVSVVLHDIDGPDDRNRWAADNMSPNCDSEAAELTVRITATYRGQAVRTFFRVDLVPVTNTR